MTMRTSVADDLIRSKQKTPQLFNQIAHRYDFLNRLLSFCMDVSWRKSIAKQLKKNQTLSILDLATGTGEVLLSLCQNGVQVKSGIGLDLSEKMIQIAEKKILQSRFKNKLSVEIGDASAVSKPDNSFDAVTMAFGIRNVPDVDGVIKECFRVLKHGGKLLILEFSLPKNFVIRAFYLVYFRHILPVIAGILSGNKKAYHYLNNSVETFFSPEKLSVLLLENGFSQIQVKPLTFGIVTLYGAIKC